MAQAHKKIGDILLEMGAIDQLQLKAALAYQGQWGISLGKALVDNHLCAEADLMRAFSIQSGHPLVDLDAEDLDPGLVSLLPAKAAQNARAVPLRLEGNRKEILVIAAAAPCSIETVDLVRTVSRKSKISIHLSSDGAIERAIGELYEGKKRTRAANAIAFGEVRIETEQTFAIDQKERPILLYGWNSARERALIAMLKLAGYEAKHLDDEQIDRCERTDVILSTTLALQGILAPGEQWSKGKLIICGTQEGTDVDDAKSLGANVYLLPPFSPEQLSQTIQKARPKRDQGR